jgi:hypothetical protein
MKIVASLAGATVLALSSQAAVYQGLFSEGTGVQFNSAGFVTLKTYPATLKYTAKISVDGDSIGFNGSYTNGFHKTILRPKGNKSALQVDANFDLSGDLVGTVSSAGWSADLKAIVAATPDTNKLYTLLYSSTTNSTVVLDGPGSAVATTRNTVTEFATNLNGYIRMATTLGDGTRAAQLLSMPSDGMWPIFSTFYRTVDYYTFTNSELIEETRAYANYAGVLMGWVSVTNSTPTGTLSWIKIGWTNTIFYPEGFTNELSVIGSIYNPPPLGQAPINMTNGIVSVSGGGLTPFDVDVYFTNGFVLKTIPYPATNGLRVAVAPKTGLLKGYFKYPGLTNVLARGQGVLLQEQNYGACSFLTIGTNLQGLMLLQPND